MSPFPHIKQNVREEKIFSVIARGHFFPHRCTSKARHTAACLFMSLHVRYFKDCSIGYSVEFSVVGRELMLTMCGSSMALPFWSASVLFRA